MGSARTYLRKERLLRVRIVGVVWRRSKTRDDGFTIILLGTASLRARGWVKRPTIIFYLKKSTFGSRRVFQGNTNAGTALRGSRQC